MKLWKVTCSIEVLIASEEEPTDYECTNAAIDEASDNGMDMDGEPEEITDLSDIPESWAGTVPRGEADATCEQIVVAGIAEREKDAWNAPMPNQKELPLP